MIFRELQATGYTGRLSILRDYIRAKRTLRVRRATVRFETAPGYQRRSDWAEQRYHGTVQEVVEARFARKASVLCSLPRARYDTAYSEIQQVSGMRTSRSVFAGIASQLTVRGRRSRSG